MPEPVWIWSCFLPSLVELTTSIIMKIIQLKLAFLDINCTVIKTPWTKKIEMCAVYMHSDEHWNVYRIYACAWTFWRFWFGVAFLPSLTEFATSKFMNIIKLNFEYLNINSTSVVGSNWFYIMYDRIVHLHDICMCMEIIQRQIRYLFTEMPLIWKFKNCGKIEFL